MTTYKKLFFSGATVLLAVLLVEGFSLLVNRLLYADRIDVRHAVEEPKTKNPDGYSLSMIASEMLHPYAGYALNPKKLSGVDPNGWFLKASQEESALPETFHVAITGGSVAGNFHADVADSLRAFLEKMLPGKQIFVSGLAVGGYKQPQQLLIMTYLLSMGYQFDLVINLDGFNDVVLPWTDNAAKGIYAFYPRSWKWRVMGTADRKGLMLSSELLAAQQRQSDWNRLFNTAPLKWSNTAQLIWVLRSVRLDRYQTGIRKRIEDYAGSPETSYPQNGPPSPAGIDSVMTQAAKIWAQSSKQLHELAKSSNFKYMHVVQPNQYIENSKPLTETEKKLLNPNEGYGPLVKKGYGFLRSHFKDLKESGIYFVDQTEVFRNERETLYNDGCCHFSRQGNMILFDALKPEIFRLVGE